MYRPLCKNIARGTILVIFMLTIGTFIHEQGHVLSVKLTGGHLLGVEYHLTYACTFYEGGNLAIIAIFGPIFGSLGLLLFAKGIGCTNEWISRSLLINLTASAHDFAYFGLTPNLWFFIISAPCFFLVTRSINEFYADLYTDIQKYSILNKIYKNEIINPALSAEILTIIEKRVSMFRRPIQNSQP